MTNTRVPEVPRDTAGPKPPLTPGLERGAAVRAVPRFRTVTPTPLELWHVCHNNTYQDIGGHLATSTRLKNWDVRDMVAMFHVTGTLVYVDQGGVSIHGEDVFSKLDKVRRCYEAIRHVATFSTRFVPQLARSDMPNGLLYNLCMPNM
ncbi:hypothetical protein CTA1_13070 [Colletotrichum tanaceti]|uniref:Uncharacterized protein n=1 Tax=Colletotrichum tanaceti TaxID=1306861 RepID=A0A4V6DHL5_9PEZI|nr:hypothetical protein CTA1_13070 [Colletotrichum tanaceti]